MQDNAMQAAFQPYVKLVQSNMELLGRYSMSPEAMSQAMANAQNLFKPGSQGVPTNLAQSQAFTELVQGMVRNYTEFMAEVAQSGIALLAQGQATWIQQAQQASEGVANATDGRSRRAR
jgi:hypothetical protein